MARPNCFQLCVLLIGLALCKNAVGQGFLQMPDTSEVPEFERESMLLDLDVPPVRDRDPDPEAGPRVNVKEFRLQGLVEYPELGITRADLIKRVEAIRFDLMEEGELTESGYTLDELGEVSDLLAEIESDTQEAHVTPLEVQKLVFLIREQRRKRGVTLGMIETVADTITRFYREKGFVLAKAYIPQQKVRDGVVTLTLLLGELGEVAVENDKRVSTRLIEGVFDRHLNKPVTSRKIEESLYLVNDVPGLSAQGFMSPGSQVGDTLLTVNVLSEQWYTLNFRVDNHGSENTGEYRAYADVLIHNPLGYGDELYLSVLNSFNPENTTYGAVRYNAFLFSPRVRGSIGYSSNDFASGNLTNDSFSSSTTVFFTGESKLADASLSYIFKRSRVKNLSTELKVTDISTELTTFFGEGDTSGIDNIDDVLNVSLGFNFDILNEKRRQLYIGNISLVHTDNAPDESQSAVDQITDSDSGESATFFNYDFSMLSFWRIPYTKANTRILLKSAGQYAGRSMTNVNQYSLTGPSRARGFQVNSLQFDDAFYLGADWIFTLPSFGGAKFFGENINNVIQPFLFADAAYGQSYPLLDGSDEIDGTIANFGAGLKINYSSFSASVSFSSVMQDEVGGIEDLTPTSGVYFDLQYSL